MRLYGGLMNRLGENGTALKVPAVGDGATVMHYSDRSAATVTKVTTSRRGVVTVFVKGDHSKRIDKNGMSEMQTYEFTPNPDAPEVPVKLRKHNGRKVWRTKDGAGIAFGYRDEYYDFTF
jgi:hypothetical protein